ncbi:MAG TPA: hypothetical protein VHY37_12815, partial [Tepidisphaeraceae bacterium]|nr:hypothetical protein [Tepidisphaeraceae bacterium]
MNRTTLLLAATMTIGGMAFTPSAFAADAAPANPNANNSQQDKAQETQDVTAVRTLIGNSTAAAVRDNGFGDLASDFAMSLPNPANP